MKIKAVIYHMEMNLILKTVILREYQQNVNPLYFQTLLIYLFRTFKKIYQEVLFMKSKFLKRKEMQRKVKGRGNRPYLFVIYLLPEYH